MTTPRDAGSASWWWPRPAPEVAPPGARYRRGVLFAQISDFHVSAEGTTSDERFRAADALARAVRHLAALVPRPDAVVCSGDLVDTGDPAEYARLHALLALLPMPVFLLPGNHDHREHLRAAFADASYLPAEGFLHYAVDLGPMRLIALDTVIPGAAGGRLCEARLAWLAERLAERPTQPTVIVQHHPPFATGIAAMDGMGLDGAAQELALLAAHPQVERVLCGHLHRAIATRAAGTLVATCPSTTLAVELDLRPSGGLALAPEPPAALLHHWSATGGLVSHTSYIGTFTPRIEVPLHH